MSTDHHFEPQSLGVECPQCGSELQLKKGRYGLFVGCSGYPDCEYMTAADFDPGTDVTCPRCTQGKLVQKTSRFGHSFFACDHYPTCKFSVPLPPVAKSCPQCGCPILLKKRSHSGERLICHDEDCGYKSELT